MRSINLKLPRPRQPSVKLLLLPSRRWGTNYPLWEVRKTWRRIMECQNHLVQLESFQSTLALSVLIQNVSTSAIVFSNCWGRPELSYLSHFRLVSSLKGGWTPIFFCSNFADSLDPVISRTHRKFSANAKWSWPYRHYGCQSKFWRWGTFWKYDFLLEADWHCRPKFGWTVRGRH